MVAGIFGASPVQPLEKHIDLGHRAASELPGFFEAVTAGDWEAAKRAHERISVLEAQAEGLKKEIRLSLPRSLFLPVSRQDILELLSVQDRVPDLALDIADIVLTRRMTIPETVSRNFTDFIARTIDATARSRKSVRELDELFSAGFRGAEAKLVEDMVEEIDRIDKEVDSKRHELMAGLLAIESSLDPVHAVFLYRVVDRITELAYTAGRIGHRLDILLAR